MPIISCQGRAGEIPASELLDDADPFILVAGPALAAVLEDFYQSGHAQIPSRSRQAFNLMLLKGCTSMEIDLKASTLRLEMVDGWDAGSDPSANAAHMAYLQQHPMQWLYSDLQPGCAPPAVNLFGTWLPMPVHALRQETTLRASRDLLTLDAMGVERIKRRKLLAQYVAKNKEEVRAVAIDWDLSADELTLHRGLLSMSAKAGHPTGELQLTPMELLEACEWPATPDNYRRLADAIEAISTKIRLRAYQFAPQPANKKGLALLRAGKWQRRATHVRVVTDRLWDVGVNFAATEAQARIISYSIRPAGDLLHQVDWKHGGSPDFARLERADLVPALVGMLGGDQRAAAKATLLANAIRSSAGERKLDASGWMRFSYAETGMMFQGVAKATKAARQPANEEERNIRDLIIKGIQEGGTDGYIAVQLAEALGRPVDRLQAKRWRERLTGRPLAYRPAPMKRNKVIAELQRLLPAIRALHPGLIVRMELPPKAVGWSVQVDPLWRPVP
jgi:hypothetical protein